MTLKKNVRSLAVSGVIAALYAALSLLLAPLSFGPVQFRAAEAMAVLPVLLPEAIPGLTLGCVLTNGIGVGMGANVAGAWDILFGTLATLLAALCTRRLRRFTVKGVPLLSTLPPILFNAVAVGLELTLFAVGRFSWTVFLTEAGLVAAGEAAAVWVLGLPLCLALRKPLSKL